LNRLKVAHFADQHDIGILPQGVFQRGGEALRVAADFSLIDDAVLVLVNELDRVLDRDHVPLQLLVDLVEHRGERGRLARAGGAGHEDESSWFVGQIGDDFGEVEVLERLDVERNLPDDHRDAAALLEAVAAESREVLNAEREIELVLHLEPLLLILGQHRIRELQRVFRLHHELDVRPRHVAVDAQHWPLARRDVEIGGVPLDHLFEQDAEIEA
jgi:hypothetical protein